MKLNVKELDDLVGLQHWSEKSLNEVNDMADLLAYRFSHYYDEVEEAKFIRTLLENEDKIFKK